jgi:hypothetical protein
MVLKITSTDILTEALKKIGDEMNVQGSSGRSHHGKEGEGGRLAGHHGLALVEPSTGAVLWSERECLRRSDRGKVFESQREDRQKGPTVRRLSRSLASDVRDERTRNARG